MGRRPPRYAVLLTSAALSTGLLLTGCGDDPKPSPPPTEEGTIAAGDPTTPGPTSPSDAPTSADPTSTSTATKSPTTTQAAPSQTTKNSGGGSPEEAGAPGVPQAARQHTLKGAEAFVRYFNKQLNVAWSKPQSGLLRPLSLPSCKTCSAYEGTAQESVKRGRHLTGPVSRLSDIQITTGKQKGSLLATATQELLRQAVVDSSGNVTDHTKAKTIFPETELRWTHGGWRVAEVRLLQ